MTERQVLCDAVSVGCPELGRFAQRSPAFGAFALQQMAPARSVKEHFAAGAYLEPLRDRFSGLNSFGTSHRIEIGKTATALTADSGGGSSAGAMAGSSFHRCRSSLSGNTYANT